MGIETQPDHSTKSWISKHPLVVIGGILVVCLGPFINKAIHVDDPLFVWTGQWIQRHPADFFGFTVNWWLSTVPMWVANCNPPLMSYFLAGAASLSGWNEIVLHLACLAVAFTAAAGIYSLARMWCDRPLLATVVAIFTPAFLVSSTTLMCDVLMLSFWIWALVLWERALGSGQSRWQFVVAGALAGLAVLTKYSAVTLLPLLPVLGILRTRKLGWWLPGLAVPLLMVAGYELIRAGMYGRGGLSGAMAYAQTHRLGFFGGWQAKGIIGLAFAGGSLLPLLFFAPLAWRWREWLAGGVVMVGALLGLFWLCNFAMLKAAPEPMPPWSFLLQVVLLTMAGLHLLLLVAAEAWQRRDISSVTLVLWIVSGLFFAIVLNWTVSARNFLPIVPAAAILLVRRLRTTGGNRMKNVRLLWPLAASAAITLSLAMADYRVADSARSAAEQIAARYKPANHQMWFEGHWGFQYYMEKLGGQPIDVERSVLLPGDVVVVPVNNYNLEPLPPGSVGWVAGLHHIPGSWVNLSAGMGSGVGGFYSSELGPIPFAVGGIPPHTYCVVKVFSKVQCNMRPTNPVEVQAGGVPRFAKLSFFAEDKTTFPVKPEAAMQIQLAGHSEAEGKIEEAIQHYRQALDMDPDNPGALNNLAWILATAGKPGLRDGERAMQLAAKAVELTDRRLPAFIRTLAAAYAEAGQFSDAIKVGVTALNLALITGQTEEAAENARLCRLYAAGKTADASSDP